MRVRIISTKETYVWVLDQEYSPRVDRAQELVAVAVVDIAAAAVVPVVVVEVGAEA